MNKTPRTRSAITSGRRLFTDRVDLRSARGLRFQDLVDRYGHDCGGDDRISETMRTMIRRVAFLQCQLEDCEADYMKTGVCSIGERLEYQRLSNTQSRLMKKVGLFNTKSKADADDDVSPLEYMKRGKTRRARLDDDEEEG
jgi:hypothetical protein